MKQIIKQIFFLSLVVAAFASCKKDENRITFDGGTSPVLSASQTGNIPLSFVNKDQEAIKFSWTNPNYQFTTGVSSQDVTYTIEIDKAGENFNSAGKKSVSISNSLSTSFTQSDFNGFLLNDLVLAPGVMSTIEVRVKSNLANATVPLYSSSMAFEVMPYAIPPKVTPSANLFLVGSASPGGWNNPVPVPSQQFTQVSTTLFELTIALNGGGSYLLLPVNGDWGAKFGGIGANNTNDVNSFDFKPGGGDLLAPPASGTYKIVVDFQRGKITLTRI